MNLQLVCSFKNCLLLVNYLIYSQLHFWLPELTKVIQPSEYEKESWQMTEDEKLNNIPILREKGNKLFKDKKIDEAASNYAVAIGILEQLMLA